MKFYHWFDFDNLMFGSMLRHNLKIGAGELSSPSLGAIEIGDDGFMNPYTAAGIMTGVERQKEIIFENIRKSEFAVRPSRRSAFWLFDDYSLALRLGEGWGLNQNRELMEVVISLKINLFKADAKWLNCYPQDYIINARRYWSGEMSTDPTPEVLLDGKIKLLGDNWKDKAQLNWVPRNLII